MKFQACREGRHGACEATVEIPQLDTEAEITYVDVHACECWCHVTPIPPPDPGEVSFELS